MFGTAGGRRELDSRFAFGGGDPDAASPGGLFLNARFPGLTDIAQKIIIDLRNRYVLGYAPTDRQRDGRYHRVHVQLVLPRGLPNMKAYWRSGYYAPSE